MIANPPMLTGSAEQQVVQMRTYLYQLAEALNVALAEVDKRTDTSITQVRQAVSTTQSENTSSYANLRDLIIKTADIIYSVEDKLKHTMNSDFVAISAFGSYYENIKSDVEETARGVVTNYNYDAKIEDLQGDYGDLLGWTAHVEGYIRQGIIGEDEYGLPVIGIAIGQNLRSLGRQTVDGIEYDVLDDTQSCAFYTSTGISFRLGGREVAYLTNEREFITMLEVGTTMTLGGKWIISHANGFTIKWIGGD